MRRQGEVDKIFLASVIILIILGILILSSASMGLLTSRGNYFNVVGQQILYGIILGGFFLIIFSKINYKIWQKFAFSFFILTFLINLLIFIPGLGIKHGGATRWLDLGKFSFHPSELLKFGFIVYLASWLSAKKKDIKSFKYGFIPFLVITSLVVLVLIKEPDIGTMGVVALTAGILFFLAGGRITQIITIIILAIIFFIIIVFMEPYRINRVKTFFKPEINPQGISYHLRQSLIAIGSGGWFGRGFGMGIQKFTYLPEPIGDSIFSVFAEEFGFIGAVGLLILFMFFVYRGFSISIRAPDDFSKLLSAGIIMLIIINSLVNISSMLGVVPMTGVPLIFISKGGSAFLITMIEIGVVLNISRYRKIL